MQEGSAYEIDQLNISSIMEKMTNASNLKTSDKPTSDANTNNKTEISITTAIFMVLLIAISTILMLCCCKAYLLCKRKRSSTDETHTNTVS